MDSQKIQPFSPKVSILVVHYHTPKQTLLCLHLLKINTFLSHEMILVDNSPQTSFSSYLSQIPWIRYIPNHHPSPSHHQALDLGASYARGEWLAPLHSDTFVIKPKWLEEILLPRQSNVMIGSWERLIWPVKGIFGKLHCWNKRRRIRKFWKKTGRSPRWISHFGLFRREVLLKWHLKFSQETNEIRDDCGLAIQRFLEEKGLPICWLFREYLSQYFLHFEGASLNAVTKRPQPWIRRKRIQEFYQNPNIQKIILSFKTHLPEKGEKT